MKGVVKKKGGKRKGAGRKPTGITKEAVTIYTDVSKFGGREGARMAIYEFLDGKINFTGKTSFVPLEWPTESHEAAKTKAIASLISQPHAVTKKKPEAIEELKGDNLSIQLQIDAIRKEVCPKERDTPIGRKVWQMDQVKRIQELQNKLK